MFLVLALLVGASGCLGLGGPSEVSEVKAPEWSVGDSWSYQAADGEWRNWTVVAEGTWHGFEAYKVQVNVTGSRGGGSSSVVQWYAVDSLGFVGAKRGGSGQGASVTSWTDAPTPPRFPLSLENQTVSYNITVQAQGNESSFWFNTSYHAADWVNVTVGNRSMDAVPIWVGARGASEGGNWFWYSPEVAWFAQYMAQGTVYRLVDWSRS